MQNKKLLIWFQILINFLCILWIINDFEKHKSILKALNLASAIASFIQ